MKTPDSKNVYEFQESETIDTSRQPSSYMHISSKIASGHTSHILSSKESSYGSY